MPPTLRLLCALGALACATSANATLTRIANNGAELTDNAVLGSGPTDWACSRDNDTGLIWEVKTSDEGLRHMYNSYTNFDGSYDPSNLINAPTNSIGFVNQVNAAALCGYGEWRMPDENELVVLNPKITPDSFPNSPGSNFWSGSPSTNSSYARLVDLFSGAGNDLRSYSRHVRLVRGGQSLVTFALSVLATGNGTGRITTGGIDCLRSNGATSGLCSAGRGNGSSVTLTAAPATGSSFVSWGGDCSGTNATCTLTMDAAKSVTVNFTKPIFPTTSLALDPATPATLYASLDGRGVYTSTDSGGSWTAINSGLTNLNVRALALQNSSTLFAASYDGGVFKGSLNGNTWLWVACGTLPNDTRLRSLNVDSSGNLYAGSETGIFKGSGSCGAWTAINTGLPN